MLLHSAIVKLTVLLASFFLNMTSLSANYQVCRRKILIVGREYHMARGYTSIGPMAPFYVFPCGHAFHAECLIAHVTRCTNEAQVCYGVISLYCNFIGFESK